MRWLGGSRASDAAPNTLPGLLADLVDPDMIPFMTLKQNCQSWKDEAAQLAAAAAAAANAPPA